MRFLCLAYGRGEDWDVLSNDERDRLLAADDVLRRRGALVSVLGSPTVVRAWEGTPETSTAAFAEGPAPLVGLSLVDAEDLDAAVELVARTPCAVARGAIEIRPLIEIRTA